MKTYVYQFALRRADDDKKQFIIETDLLLREKKFKEEEIKAMSEKYKCDMKVTLIGMLTPAKEEQEISIDYHSKDMISSIINDWKEKEREAFVNDTRRESV